MADPNGINGWSMKKRQKFKKLPCSSIKSIAESIGFSHLPESCAQELSASVTFAMKDFIQEATKFRDHRKGRQLTCGDIDNTLKSKGIEPSFGLATSEYIPLKYTGTNGKEVHYKEELEADLNELVNTSVMKIPYDVSLKVHWLAIEGVQPNIPENPAPAPVFELNILDKDAGDGPTPWDEMTSSRVANNNPLLSATKVEAMSSSRSKQLINLKERFSHELAVEQQLYYKEITEAAVGSNEARRAEALTSLSRDPGLSQLLPRFSTFIAEGVRVNVAQNNLALLIYLMRMVRALMDNPSLKLEKYLHELNPAVMTCIVSKQLCSRPDHDNHWALRDYAARLMGHICRGFNTTTNQIQPRVSSIFCKSLYDPSSSLSARYGCVVGLSELGPEVIQKILLPRLHSEGDRLQSVFESQDVSAVDLKAAQKLRAILVKHCASVIKSFTKAPDDIGEYEEKYGSGIGQYVYNQVVKLRDQEAHKSRLYASTGLSISKSSDGYR